MQFGEVQQVDQSRQTQTCPEGADRRDHVPEQDRGDVALSAQRRTGLARYPHRWVLPLHTSGVAIRFEERLKSHPWNPALFPEKYGYQEGDITMMLDDEKTLGDPERSHLIPLRGNLVSLMVGPHAPSPSLLMRLCVASPDSGVGGRRTFWR